MKGKILFVVHRYAPFPGGSEINVKNMAEEMLGRGYEVTVVAATHQGDYNGVKVTNDHNVLFEKWDLIIVHGGDVISQNIAHTYAADIKSPVLYLIIKPSESDICMMGLREHDYLGYGSSFDLEHITKHGQVAKARQVRYGIPWYDCMPTPNLQLSRPENSRVFISIGGFAEHKRMRELGETFIEATKMNPNYYLLTMGYSGGEYPPDHPNITIIEGADRSVVMTALSQCDALIMNSSEEGFGLVLLEAMFNKVPWIARDIAGAHDMWRYGNLYRTQSELLDLIVNFDRVMFNKEQKVTEAYKYAMENHTIERCVDDIERILSEHN